MKSKRSRVQTFAARRTTDGRSRLRSGARLKKERDELLAKLAELHAERKQYLLSLKELTRTELAAAQKKSRFAGTTPRGRHDSAKFKQQLEDLRHEVRRIEAHCDACRRACAVLMWTEDEKFDEDEALEALKHFDELPTFADVMRELEAELVNAV